MPRGPTRRLADNDKKELVMKLTECRKELRNVKKENKRLNQVLDHDDWECPKTAAFVYVAEECGIVPTEANLEVIFEFLVKLQMTGRYFEKEFE